MTGSQLRMCSAIGVLLCVVTPAEAVTKDKARLIASTELTMACRGVFSLGLSTEGRISTSDATFRFSAGSRSLSIPYGHIASVTYGHVTPQEIGRLMNPCPDASFVEVPHDYSPVVQDLLTITYRDARGLTQTAMLWLEGLGRALA